MNFNLPVLAGVALVPLVMGMIWYNPKVFGKAWAETIGMTEEQMNDPANKSGMWKVFLFYYIFSFFSCIVFMWSAVHQWGAFGMIEGNVASAGPSYAAFMAEYGNAFRTFKHGALHGGMAALCMGLFMIGGNALFEKKSWKYIFINVGFYFVCGMIMGGLICQFQ